ncbi:MAG TPA: Uma2 family endonuclease [Candidatus Brocadiia bacterium]|nr:Uma2 family endonuclease [Candidatus Brocadiales bacterium]
MTKIPESLKFTYKDYLLLPADKRYEIIEGDLYMIPSPFTKHQEISFNLTLILSEFIRQEDLGKIFYAPCDVLLSEYDIVQPDILFISKERSNIITEKNIQGAPDLIIEILSRSRKHIDKRLKSRLYARSGVKEYWIVDPDKETIEVLTLGVEGYKSEGIYGRKDKLKSTVLKGLSVNVTEVFP